MKRRNKRVSKPMFFIVALLIFAFSFAAFFGLDDYRGDTRKIYFKGAGDIRWGIDISGGVEAIFSPDKEADDISSDDMDSAKQIIETRLVNKNIVDYEVYTDYDNHQIIVRFPWQSDQESYDPTEAVNELGETALLSFYKGETKTGTPVLEGSADIIGATPQYVKGSSANEYTGYVVALELTEQGKTKFAAATEAQIGKTISIWMDDTLISAPTVNTKITDGNAIITGMESAEAATELAQKINAGSLPFALTIDDSKLQVISPILGEEALKVMLIAGIAAFVVICIIMILKYRLPGVIASIALLGQAAGMIACSSGFFSGIPSFTLTLPGIAGIVLSIGFGVDANVITAERIKEEFRKGKTIDGAISQGYSNAFSSIFDGNLTNVIIAIVLLAAFGTPDSILSQVFNFIFPFLSASVTGNIYSFGYTLLTGVIFNFIMGVTASRLMLMSISRIKCFRKPWLYGGEKIAEPKKLDYVKSLKPVGIIIGCIMLVGVTITSIFGVKLDVNFAGGSRFTYAYTGDISTADVENTIKDELGVAATVTKSSDYSSNSQKLVITFSGDVMENVNPEIIDEILKEAEESKKDETTEKNEVTVTPETTEKNSESMISFQNALGAVLSKNFTGSTFTRGEANSVNSTLAGEALIKIIVTVVLAALLIVTYIAIRFRKVGGVSAAIASLIALVHDIIIAFFACAIFGLDIDANFFAVALTLFGYSINATIVIFDRIRENKRYYSGISIRECANRSINETLARSIMTSISTFASIVAIVVIAELFGVTSLRSFAIPMGIGVISGCFSSIFVAGPLWVKWKEFRASKKAKIRK